MENAHSVVGLYGWLAVQNSNAGWYSEVWRRSEWPTDRVPKYPAHLNGAVKVIGARYPFAKMSDQEGLNAKLADFAELLYSNGFR